MAIGLLISDILQYNPYNFPHVDKLSKMFSLRLSSVHNLSLTLAHFTARPNSITHFSTNPIASNVIKVEQSSCYEVLRIKIMLWLRTLYGLYCVHHMIVYFCSVLALRCQQ